jgi:hypothetical protein
MAIRWIKGAKHPVTGESVGGRYMSPDDLDHYRPDGSLVKSYLSPEAKAWAMQGRPKTRPKAKAKTKTKRTDKKLPVHLLPPSDKRDIVTNMFKSLKASCKPAYGIDMSFSTEVRMTETLMRGTYLAVSYDLCTCHEAVIRGTLMMAIAKAVGQEPASLFPDSTIILADGMAYCGPGSPL